MLCFLLIQGSHVINLTNNAGNTPLHQATQYGYTPVVDVLLSHGADINFLTAEGQSCLHLAAELCNQSRIKVNMTHTLTQVQLQYFQKFSQCITCSSLNINLTMIKHRLYILLFVIYIHISLYVGAMWHSGVSSRLVFSGTVVRVR